MLKSFKDYSVLDSRDLDITSTSRWFNLSILYISIFNRS